MANNHHFDLIAPLYDRLIVSPNPDRMRALLDMPGDSREPAAGWMLDAGGGTGRVTSLLCGQVERLAISDLSLPMLRQASRKGCRLLPAQASVERLPFADGTFSRILVTDAFHHFSDQPGAAAELVRVLHPGGRLVIGEPDIRRFAVQLIALGETLLLMGSRFRSPAWIERMLATQGLQTRVENEGAMVWITGLKPERKFLA